MSTGLLVPHQSLPNLERIKIISRVIEQAIGVCSQQSRDKAVAQQATGCISTVGVKAKANDRFAITHYVCDDRQCADGHLTEIDVSIANVRFDGDRSFTNSDNLHCFTSLSRSASRLS